MGKAEKGTPKDIAKRIKSKGLQKLKFYCQLCEKQCRDANGFKCHMTSESHLRQMKIFSENAHGIMDRYSRDFEVAFLQTLKQRHTTKRTNANNVYQELIQDKQHIHMNSTKWATLSDFVMYLGRKGKCKVDETERGWYVQYIEVDASILSRQAAQERRVAAERQAEEEQAARMEQQRVAAAQALDQAGGVVQRVEATKLERPSDGSGSGMMVTVSLVSNTTNSSSQTKKKKKPSAAMGFFEDNDDEDDDEEELKPPAILLPEHTTTTTTTTTRKRDSTTHAPNNSNSNNKDKDDTKEESTKQKRSQRSEESNEKGKHKKGKEEEEEEVPWLKRDIIVRIITQKLHQGKYFRQKAIVDKVLKDNKFCAEVEVLAKGGEEDVTLLRLDQKDLETVVPKEGKKVKILKGKYRGEIAKLVQADKKRYRATLELLDDRSGARGKVLEKMDFEDFSQLA